MATGSELLQALMGLQTSPSQEGTGIAAQAIANASPLLVNPYASTGSNVASTLGAGLVAALLGGLARNEAASDNAAIMPLANEYLGANPDRQAELLRQQPKLANLQGVMLSNALDRASKVADLKATLPVENQFAVEKAKEMGPVDTANSLKKTQGEKLLSMYSDIGQTVGPDGSVVQVVDPGAKTYADKVADIKAQRDATGGSGLMPKDISNLETDVTNKLTTGPVAQSVMEVQSRAKQVLDAVETRDPLHAASAIYGFAKLLDPQGVVRQDDGKIVADPGGPAGYVASLYNDILQKGKITDATASAMKELVPKLAQYQYDAYASQRDAMIGSASAQGANASRIGFLPPPGQSLAAALNAGQPAPQDAPAPPPGFQLAGINPQTGKYLLEKIGP